MAQKIVFTYLELFIGEFLGEFSLFAYFSGNFGEKNFSPKFSFWGVIFENLGGLGDFLVIFLHFALIFGHL